LAIGDNGHDGDGEDLAYLADQGSDVLDGSRQETSGQQHLAAEAVPQDPEDLVADMGLQPVDGQDGTALGKQERTETFRIGGRNRAEFVVAVEQVADRPFGDHDPAAAQFGVNLGYAAVLDISEVADKGNDVKPELVMGQGKMGFRLWSIGFVKARARGVGACRKS
jgi:hypothetical protein